MTGFGLVVRWLHLIAGILLTGTFTLLLLSGRPTTRVLEEWQERLLRLTRWIALILLATGLGSLGYQAVVVTGISGLGALEPSGLSRLLTDTQFGVVWLLRHGLLLLLAGLILTREREESGWDWLGFRGEGLLLGGIGLGLMAWAGHAAAVEPWPLLAALVDGAHLVAVGIWMGGLLPLALLLRAARHGEAESQETAARTTRHFSQLALASMLVLAITGFWNSWSQVGDLPSLVGTRYGHLLLVKLALLVPILILAAVNRRRLVPRLREPAPDRATAAMSVLSRYVALEFALGLAILLVVSVLGLTPPGRHDQPWWPFPFRFSFEAGEPLPGFRWQLLVGSQVALVGLLGLIAAWLVDRGRRLVLSGGGALFLAGLLVALPPLAVDAYPTTYRRTPVPYQAISIASGRELYTQHCAACHGTFGYGDGPSAREVPRRPGDLTGRRTSQHTAGDLFWWISHGFGASPDHRFRERLSEEARWDLVNLVRTLGSAERARTLGSVVEPDRPWLVAPDFAFQTGPGPGRTLKDWRGRRAVLLVMFTLPQSRPRLVLIARNYDLLQAMGAEVLAVPTDGGREILTRLGSNPRILFPVAVEGGEEIVATYALLGRTRHAATPPDHLELLIDRQGYLRARWIPDGGGWTELSALFAEIQQLNQETPAGPPPDEHVH